MRGLLCIALCCSFVAVSAQENQVESRGKREDRADLDAKFREQLTGAVMEGYFTIDGRKKDGPPSKDKYTIDSVAKIQDGKYLITARMQYMNVDIKVPAPVEVRWAGETPMICLTDVSLPGMKGKFSTRLLIDGTRYAGTWSHDRVGGHMWGSITKPKNGDKPEAKAEKKSEGAKSAKPASTAPIME